MTIDYDDGATATHDLSHTTIVAGGTGEPQGKPVTPPPTAETDDDGFDAIVSDMAQRIATVTLCSVSANVFLLRTNRL